MCSIFLDFIENFNRSDNYMIDWKIIISTNYVDGCVWFHKKSWIGFSVHNTPFVHSDSYLSGLVSLGAIEKHMSFVNNPSILNDKFSLEPMV